VSTPKPDGRATLRDIFALVRDSDLSPEEKTLWLLYRSYDTGDGAWPGDDILAEHIGKSVRSVKLYKAKLREHGLLDVEFRGPNPAVHRAIYPAKAVQPTAPQGDERDAMDCTARDAEDCTPASEAMQEGVQKAMQEGVQPTASSPTPPISDEYGNTGIRDTPPEGAEPDIGEAVESESLEENETTDSMAANELVGAWIARQPARPPESVIRKQGAFAKRLVRDCNRSDLERAIEGIGRLYPHSNGEPWDLGTLEKKLPLALAAPAANGTRRNGYQDPAAGIDYAAEAAKHHGGAK
jgi:hypothetical protein